MTTRELFNIFPFQASWKDEDTNHGMQIIIRIYGLNERNKSVCVKVENFKIPIILELPDIIDWTEEKIKLVAHHLQNMNSKKNAQPSSIHFQMMKKLYFANVELDDSGPHKYKEKLFPYLMVMFSSERALTNFVFTIKQKDVSIPGLGNIKLKPHSAEKVANPYLKLVGIRHLPTANWMMGRGVKISGDNKETTKDYEYAVSFTDLIPMSEERSMKMPIVYPKVLAIDGEMNSTDPTRMPRHNVPGDRTFQISAVMLDRPTDGKVPSLDNMKTRKMLFSLGKPDPSIVGDDVKIFNCRCEGDIYSDLSKMIVDEDPDIITGFNIMGFDIPYMIDRSTEMCSCFSEFARMGCIKNTESPIDVVSWYSAAYGKQEYRYINAEGRLIIDLLPYIKNKLMVKLANYRLETICDEFLKTNKDPLKPKDIFRAYKMFTPDKLGEVGKYCVKDSEVCIMLFLKLLIWADITESANVSRVPPFYMYAKGEQIKMYSSIYEYAFHDNRVVESDVFKLKGNEVYEGAFVSEPIKGLYRKVIPFDFQRLYPSMMVAYNVDFTKLCTDDSIPDEDTYVFDWETHKNCEHDIKNKPKRIVANAKAKVVTCAKYKYRFLKETVSGQGVVPILLDKINNARVKTRVTIKENDNEIEIIKRMLVNKPLDESLIKYYNSIKDNETTKKYIKDSKIVDDNLLSGMYHDSVNLSLAKERYVYLEDINTVLNKRQEAFKIRANSMYGAMGVKKGYLPFLPGAMCITYMGRSSILKANKFIEENTDGKVIYNDTDSAYCHFPSLQNASAQEIWKFCEKLEGQLKGLFPPPMSLDFEGKVYEIFLILSKKRYAGLLMNKYGDILPKLAKRGIVLQRRDNNKCLRDCYEQTLMDIFKYYKELTLLKGKPKEEIMKDDSVKYILDRIIEKVGLLFVWHYGPRDFVITKQMAKEKYIGKRIPAHAYLAEKMVRRGVPISQGTRLEYLLTDNDNGYKKKELQQDKIEDINYFLEFREILRMDYIAYFKMFIKPVDQLLSVAIGIDKFIDSHWKLRVNKWNVVRRIKQLNEPTLVFEEDEFTIDE